MNAVVIIPAYNEEASIQRVLRDIPWGRVREVIVVDNNSTDWTAERAREAGATVVHEPQRGYGHACLRGMAYAASLSPDVVVFLDADYSDYPEEMERLLDRIAEGYDMVLGSRTMHPPSRGALLPQARMGNRLAVTLIRWFFRYRYTDLGPFRAVRWSTLLAMEMQDRNYGWTVEMQIKAAKLGLRVTEVPVRYRPRIGRSKVSGTLSGTLKAGYKILFTIFRYGLMR